MAVSVIFTIIYLALLGLCLFIGWKRHWVRSALSFVTAALSFAGAYFLTRQFVSLRGEAVSNVLKEELLELMNLRNEFTVRETAMLNVSAFIVDIILGMVMFWILFLLLWLAANIIKRVLVKLITKKKYSELAPFKDIRPLGAAIKLASFLLVSTVFIYPLGAASDILCSAADNCGRRLPASVITNPISRIYGGIGRGLFDSLTETGLDGDFKNSEEIERGAEIVISLRDFSDGGDEEGEAIERICGSFRSSYLLTDFTSELVANAANSWKNGASYMYNTVDIPKGRNGELVNGVLTVLSEWRRENLLNDIDTALNTYDLLKSQGVTKIDDSKVLLKALEREEFTESLFLELSQNGDFIELIPKVMRFGIGSAMDAMKLDYDDEYTVEFDAKALDKNDWKKEARAFSTLLRRMNMIKELTDGHIDLDDFDIEELMEDFDELKDSRLLSNILVNGLIQVVINAPQLAQKIPGL